MTAASYVPADPRTRSAKGWRARSGQLAAAGVAEDDSRVIETRAALSWYRTRSFLIKEGTPAERVDSLMDLLWPPPEAEPSEAEDAPTPDAATESSAPVEAPEAVEAVAR